MDLHLDTGQLDAVAPFAIVCSRDLVIEHAGPSLSKALGRELTGCDLLDEFVIDRPHGITSAADILERASSSFLLRYREHDLSLRCQPICPPDGDRIIFFGSLALASETDISRLGLGYGDFAASDPTPDLLILRRAQERSLKDLAVLNAELSQSSLRLRGANAALTEAERRLRALVEQQPLVTYIDGLGEDQTTEFVSANILELTGYPPERWSAEPNFFFSVIHPDDLPGVLRDHVAATHSGEPYRGEFRLIRADGATVWVQDEDQVVLDDEGRALYRLGYMLDVTERRTTEQRLRETGARLATLVASLQEGVLLEDENRDVALTNSAFCSVFGIPVEPDALIGTDCAGAAQASKALAADPERFVTRIDEILARGLAVYGEEVEFADGRVFERDYVPMQIAGEQRGHLWVYSDVTAHIEAQRAIEEAHDRAVEASRAKSEFLATVSHEIRSPMHGVLGTLDLLKDADLDVEQAELVAIVESSASNLLAVINDMLDLQKAESGRMELSDVPIDLASIVDEALDTVRVRAQAKGIELLAEVQEGVPENLLGDPGRLRQIVLNLVANAVKFTDAGTVSVTVRLDAISRRLALVSFVVRDTGIGIAEQQLKHIFEPFSQADASTTRRHEGTGLGLAITRRLVELMDGDIRVRSRPGTGTTFTASVSLLCGPEKAPAKRERKRERPELTGSVLLAEDSPVNRELGLRQLNRLGLRARAVDSGSAAVDALEHERYDAVLMDMRMPGMDGLEATRAIRAREHESGRPRTPIIAVTANAMHSDRTECMDAGMDDFAAKPLMLDELAQALSRWLPDPPDGEPAASSPAQDTNGLVAGDDDARRIREKLTLLADELGSLQSARRVVQAWLAELPGRIGEAAECAASEDRERLREVAHTLKSTCGLVDAAAAAALAAEIERAAAAGEPVPSGDVDRLVGAAERAERVVTAWFHETESGAHNG